LVGNSRPRKQLPTDFVRIFVGGEPTTAFPKKIGVGFGMAT